MQKLLCAACLCWVFIHTAAAANTSDTCHFSIDGIVEDEQRTPLVGAEVWLENTEQGTTSNERGEFLLQNICGKKYILKCRYLGYKLLSEEIFFTSPVHLHIQLEIDAATLTEIVVMSTKNAAVATLQHTSLTPIEKLESYGKTLGESLKNIAGMNTIETGSSISKPVIHGLHSNRILILNNGIRQEGQQWGSDHAPEIDPFTAENISVLRGAASIRYGAEAMGGVILLEPKLLPKVTGLSGVLLAGAGSNSRMGFISGSIENAAEGKWTGFAWRLQGTLKRAGNARSPNYYLENTGFEEQNFSLAAQYVHKKYSLSTYFSSFNTKIGIFKGSHVGNIADLYAAFGRQKPITADTFSYKINRSFQKINHNLLKINFLYDWEQRGKIETTFAQQNDWREEYDLDLPLARDPTLRSKPELAFNILTHTLDCVWKQPIFGRFFSGEMGISGITQTNNYKGFRYLIPNYWNFGAGVFQVIRYTREKFTLEGGLRYDYRWLQVFRSNPITLLPENPTKISNNVTLLAGGNYRFNSHFSMSANVGTAWRPPAVSELYINGIHLSAASYELGDNSLRNEMSQNINFSTKYECSHWDLEVGAYYNNIKNFIYSRPTLGTVSLLSGTYPLFVYTQTNAQISGLDASGSYHLTENWTASGKATLLRAWNSTAGEYLPLMPSDRLELGTKYDWKQPKAYVSCSGRYVARQRRVPQNSDYTSPPSAYFLLGANAGCSFFWKHQSFDVSLGASNLLNKTYREYLNRFRYFSDEVGTDVTLKLICKFGNIHS